MTLRARHSRERAHAARLPDTAFGATGPLLALLIALPASACAGGSAAGPDPSPGPGASPSAAELTIPEAPASELLPRVRVATGLLNPRGMHRLPSGELIVAEAGTGRPADGASGRLTRLRDANGDGDYLDAGERVVLLADQPSRNILDVVRRDEVFGMAGIAEGGGALLASLAFFGGPSKVFAIAGDSVTPWGGTHGNLNDLAFDPAQGAWFGVASTTDEVIRLQPGGTATRVLKLPPLPNGQDAVPGYLRHDPVSTQLVVSLFSGSPEGEEGGEGTELVPRAGALIAVDVPRRSFRYLVSGLTVPTDFEITADGSIYVLEFCDRFLEPVRTPEEMDRGPSHGGFARFSGRLLRVERPSGRVTVVAEQLDAPTNLALAGDALYVAQGMGTPGRAIPGLDGPQPLEGFIERIALSGARGSARAAPPRRSESAGAPPHAGPRAAAGAR
jgi:hypothetical protein